MGIALSILLSTIFGFVGIAITANVNKSMPDLTGMAAIANQTTYATFNNVYSAFSLTSFIPILAIAGGSIVLVIGILQSMKKSGVWTT